MKSIIIKVTTVVWVVVGKVGRAFKREAKETRHASKILMKIVKGKEVTSAEVNFLKEQSFDLGKALTIIGLQAVPGSSFAIAAIEAVLQKNGLTLFPKEQKDPWLENNDTSETTALIDYQKNSKTKNG
jgi:hypothetical protein